MLYRDCLRLIRHVSGTGSPKSVQLRAIVRGEFKRNAHVTGAEQLEELQANAVRALTNSVMLEQTAARARTPAAKR